MQNEQTFTRNRKFPFHVALSYLLEFIPIRITVNEFGLTVILISLPFTFVDWTTGLIASGESIE